MNTDRQLTAARISSDAYHFDTQELLASQEEAIYAEAQVRTKEDDYLDEAVVELLAEDNHLAFYIRELVKGKNTDPSVLFARSEIRQMVEDKVLSQCRVEVAKGLQS